MARSVLSVMLVASLAANVVLGICCAFVYRFSELEPEISPQLTADAVLGLEPGTSCDEVVRAMGYPVRVESGGTQFVDPRRQDAKWPDLYVWQFATPGVLELSPRVSVGIRNCQVQFVSVAAPDERWFVRDSDGARGTLAVERIRSLLPNG